MHNARLLRDLRLRGLVPLMVYIDLDFPVQYGRGVPFSVLFPHLYIGPEENVRTLDLRVLKGLTVQVNGFDVGRMAALEAVIAMADAKRIITVLHRVFGEGEFQSFPIVSVTDTEGVLTWQDS